MSRFYGFLLGSRREVTQLGTEESGIVCCIQGQKVGVQVSGMAAWGGEDMFVVVLTSGSSMDLKSILIGSFTRSDLEDMLGGEESVRPTDTTE